MNYGLRWEYFKSAIDLETAGNGRFADARSFGPEDDAGVEDASRRASASAYDLFGNAKTALKFSANKYMLSATDGVAADYNPMRLQTQNVDWRDLNSDDIAQGEQGCVYLTAGCELNFAQLPANFGVITPGCQVVYSPGSIPCGTDQVDPDIKRPYNVRVPASASSTSCCRGCRSPPTGSTPIFYNAYLKVNTLTTDRRLHAGADRQPDRRQRGDGLQRQFRQGQLRCRTSTPPRRTTGPPMTRSSSASTPAWPAG